MIHRCRDFSATAARESKTVIHVANALAAAIALTSGSAALAQANSGALPAAAAYTDRIIVRYRDDHRSFIASRSDMFQVYADHLSNTRGHGKRLRHHREMGDGSQVLKLDQSEHVSSVQALAAQLAQDPTVLYAEPDVRMFPQLAPNDVRYKEQWHYFETIGGINLPKAWDITTGSPNVVVAVIDTGYRPHADLAAKIIPGFDFVADITTGNDGNGRDADASDPGDACSPSSSSWHGTHVAGTIGAVTDNGFGVAGINWQSKILPVRVLGKCGGFTSDIVDGMRWAAGLAVPNVPTNTKPAKVLNLSLGGSGKCSTTQQNAINAVVAAGTTVVVAAGNSNADAANFSPASCTNVISVAAINRKGARAPYSNFGTSVKIAAPGGDTSTGSADGVLSTLNAGKTTPGADSYAFYQGTSMATPHVVGVVSLMLSVKPTLTPAQVLSILQSTARKFPTGTGRDCSATTSTSTTKRCGAGIVDAAAAVAAAQAVR